MKITRSFPSSLVLAAGFVLASGATRAAPTATTWENDLLNVQALTPNPQTVAFNGNFTVPASNIHLFPNPFLLLSIGPTSVTFQNTNSSAGAVAPASTIIKVTDLTARRIENVQIDPASNVVLTGPLISGDNFLQFDAFTFLNHTIPASGVFTLDVTFTSGLGSPVPEPASLALFGSGLAGLLLIRRRRSTTPT